MKPSFVVSITLISNIYIRNEMLAYLVKAFSYLSTATSKLLHIQTIMQSWYTSKEELFG